jgi:hypothetical protein
VFSLGMMAKNLEELWSNVSPLTLCSWLTCTQNHMLPSLNYKQYKSVHFMFWEDIWKSSASFDFTKKPDELFSKKFPFFWALLSDFEDTHKHGIYCYNKFRHKYQYNMSKGRIPSLYFFEFLFSRLFKGIFHHKNTYYFRTNSNCFYSIRY